MIFDALEMRVSMSIVEGPFKRTSGRRYVKVRNKFKLRHVGHSRSQSQSHRHCHCTRGLRRAASTGR